ncbi:MAG: carbohydrate ABC transporter permease [Devosia nanyangense]|uniref:sn-glycerol-3-phosphate transport system permease protein UgpE n=1 Tax=Devosia nanyangense TaxID=1228055 RepID=A0A933L259_9HYPH|nr:carbohydrate ABC transporter permease [Devosia nanyangense]
MPRFRIISIALHLLVSVWALFVLAPVVWMVLAGFRTRADIFTQPLGLPKSLGFDAFVRAWNTGIAGFILNSVLVTVASVGLIVAVSSVAAYVLARSDHPALKWIYVLIVASFAVPAQSVLVPLYQIISGAGLLNSLFAIVLPYAAYGIPFTTVLFYAFFLEFPRELEEAARLDGCNRLQVITRVVLPLSGSAMASAAIFQAVFVWNEFLLALLLLTDKRIKTLPLGMLNLRGQFSADWPAIMAGVTMVTLPMLILFVLAQRYFVRSLAGLGK